MFVFIMNIIFDTREVALHAKYVSPLDSTSPPPSIPISVSPLHLADVVIQYNSVDLVFIERKSMTDLVSSIKDGRYEEQSYRLLSASNIHPHNIIYIIEGVFSQLRTSQEKKMAQSAMTSLALFKGFSVIRTTCLNETAEFIAAMASKLNKEIQAEGIQKMKYANFSPAPAPASTEEVAAEAQSPNVVVQNAPYCTVVKKIKKENITPENIGEIILCQIPSISSTNAIEIMKHFDNNFRKFMDEIKANPDCLNTIRIDGKRKLGINVIQNIHQFFRSRGMRHIYLRRNRGR
jgi:ERCC4-type nuclease